MRASHDFDLFPISTLEALTDLHAKWIKRRGCTQDVPFAETNATFHTRWTYSCSWPEQCMCRMWSGNNFKKL